MRRSRSPSEENSSKRRKQFSSIEQPPASGSGREQTKPSSFAPQQPPPFPHPPSHYGPPPVNGFHVSGPVAPADKPVFNALIPQPPIAPGTPLLSLIPPVGIPPLGDEKMARELFVGNTPVGVSNDLLHRFLNGAMRKTNLAFPVEGDPIVMTRVSEKFAFIQLRSPIETCNALNMTGIPFMGAFLKIARPGKYVGPVTPFITWNELLGNSKGPTAPSTSTASKAGEMGGDGGDKINRELFVGNTNDGEMTAESLKQFIETNMKMVGLDMPEKWGNIGEPLLRQCRLTGKFAFLEFRSVDECSNALNLDNIPFCGVNLMVKRPSKYTGPRTKHGNWDDILTKVMSGDIVVKEEGAVSSQTNTPSLETANAPSSSASPTATSSQPQQAAPATSRVVQLTNMVTLSDLQDPTEYEDILEDTKEEASQFGAIKRVVIPKSGPHATKIYIEFESAEGASKAIQGLGGRTFDGNTVGATYFDEEEFENSVVVG